MTPRDDLPHCFQIVSWEERPALHPVINGVGLLDLVGRYEQAQGYEPSGAYAVLDVAFAGARDLEDYLLGPQHHRATRRVTALGCECGLVDDWPWEVDIRSYGRQVVWSDFGQPYRPEWDYTGLGSFAFGLRDYRRAIADAQEELRLFAP